MAYKYKYYRKVIPAKYREQLGITEYKLSLKDIHSKHQTLIKSIFEVEFMNIFNNIDRFDSVTLKEYLELIYHKTLLDLYGIKSDLLDIYFTRKEEESKIYTLNEAVELFTKYNTKDLKLSHHTLKNHKNYNNKLLEFFGGTKNILEITDDELENFKDSFNVSNNTWNNYLSYYNKMFKYLIKKKKIQYNIFEILDKAETIDSNKIPFDDNKEIENIINSCSDEETKMAMLLQCYCGLRIEEVQTLTKDNIDIKNKILHITLADTKTKKHKRDIPIHNNLIKYLEIYLNKFTDKEQLFITKNLGKKLNKHIQTIVKNINKSNHSFRKNFRINLQLNFPDMETYINILMGHSNKSNIGFHLYGKNKTDFKTLEKMINSIDYNI